MWICVNVIVCLYFSFRDRVINLFILIVVDVRIDILYNRMFKVEFIFLMKLLLFNFILRMIKVVLSGWVIRLIKRLVIVRYLNNSFVGGWREVILCRVIRIKMLFKDVVMDRKMLEIERKIIMFRFVSYVVEFGWFDVLFLFVKLYSCSVISYGKKFWLRKDGLNINC